MTVVLISFIVIVLTSLKPRKMGGGIHVTQQINEKEFVDGLAAGKDHQFKGRYDAEKNAVIISLKNGE